VRDVSADSRGNDDALEIHHGDGGVSHERTGVLYLAPWVDLGGSDKGTIDWFRHIDRDRWAPCLITTQPSPNRWLRNVEPYADEVWVLPDLMTGREFPEFILGFIVSRRIRVVHIMHSRLGMDLMPDISALPDPPAIVVQLHLEEPHRGGYAPYVADRYSQVVDAFSVSSEHLAETMNSYGVPRTTSSRPASTPRASGRLRATAPSKG
jgi:hypothetical protein